MILTYTAEQFKNVNGMYYSPAFTQDEKDTLITVAIWASEPATAKMEASINETDWVEVFNSSFTISNAGLQTYTDCHYQLVYRIVVDKAPTKAHVLI